MKLQKQLIFSVFVGGVLASLGLFLGVNQLSDWTLFTLGATLIVATLCSSVVSSLLKTESTVVPIQVEEKR